MSNDIDIPQWKKDLIARLRSQNRRTASVVERQQEQQQLYGSIRPPQSPSVAVGRAVQQPSLTCLEPVAAPTVVPVIPRECAEKCNASSATCNNQVKMVQERSWEWSLRNVDNGGSGDSELNDSDSSEDLQYGPGIVHKLREKYLSLALRGSNVRKKPSMRKAASLENILDDGGDVEAPVLAARNRIFQTRLNGSKNVPNRYTQNASRGSELKRARSVEAILRASEDDEQVISEARPKRESLHEEMLINVDNNKTGNDKYKTTNDNLTSKILEQATPDTAKPYTHRKNRPKRIAPIMNPREKPPADLVKQNKLIFEKCAENRTKGPQQTGEVAAKIATFTSIISEHKAAKKPPIKAKPVIDKTANGVRIPKPKTVPVEVKESVTKTPSLPSPIPDISRVDFTNGDSERGHKNNTSLSETPDLIMTSSPLAATVVHSPTFRISATENFIKQEILNSNKDSSRNGGSCSPIKLSPTKTKPVLSPKTEDVDDDLDGGGVKRISRESIININNASNTMTFNFANNSKSNGGILPTNKNILNTRTPPSQPLKVEINGVNNSSVEIKSPNLITDNVIIKSSPPLQQQTASKTNNLTTGTKPNLTIVEIEKNLKNSAKLQEQQQNGAKSVIVKSDNEVTKILIPKVKKQSSVSREPENNSIVFKFTHRKDVPDYLHNEGTNRSVKFEKPKVGEGGIILLPGATIDFTDDDEILKSLEGPPSPCDVSFINDNILIDGKSSLSQKRKNAKMRITFVEAGPEVFEYPSESSMLKEESPTSPSNAQLGHAVPSLTGSSSLANYQPKGTAEEFHPGVTRSVQNIPTVTTDTTNEEQDLQEAEQPILFSAGTNSDILF